MSKKSRILYTFALLAFTLLLYIASLGLGVMITKWFDINLETGCSLRPKLPSMMNFTDNYTTPPAENEACNTGMYKCTVSNPFNFYVVCPMFGTAICMIAVIAGIIYCVKSCTERRSFYPNYDSPYSQVIGWHDE